jgi:diguanylate cyclase (GGDEF)-like protein
VVYILGGFHEGIDPTPFGFAATGVIMAYAILTQELFTFSPVARALIVDQIGDAVMVLNPGGRILDLNASGVALARALCPDAPVDLIGLTAVEVFGPVLGADQAWTELTAGLPGGQSEFQVRSTPLLDARGELLGEVFVARDVTEANTQARSLIAANARLVRQVETIERLRADLVELSSRDALTGLHNRRYMVDRFAHMLAAAQRTGASLAVVLLDIDRFKAINDVHGHLVGDEALVELAHRIRALAPPGALVARWGGEEFFVALPGADAATGLSFADEVRELCERDGIPVAGHLIPCTLSGGVATYPDSGDTLNGLFHAADVALFEAKKAGRNSVRLHVRSTGPLLDDLLQLP